MEIYYTGVSSAVLAQIEDQKLLVLTPLPETSGVGKITLTEDFAYWAALLRGQADKPAIEEYEYAYILEVSVMPGVIAGLVTDSQTGRVSQEVHEIMQQAQKPPMKIVDPNESEIVVLSDIRKSDEGSARDGLSQTYEILCNTVNSPLLDRLNDGVQKIVQMTGIVM